MKKYAITERQTNEFYPDPIYTDLKKAQDKIEYLNEYRVKNNMPVVEMFVEELTPEREEQHNTEWKRFVDMLD
jgi:hypothetical protein